MNNDRKELTKLFDEEKIFWILLRMLLCVMNFKFFALENDTSLF